ncbi:MAG: helix-turn-helix transcriptional regulator [Anaerolineales bacterium]|nr:helix-turn-helix transcriptional regulator [Anaerolineales bacterium]MDW8446358.1 helix-turn-helix transcriptional regulator [Anaerolineales bacterium]
MEEFPRLTNREWEVLKLLLQGKANKRIAWELGISERTVEFHLKNIYAKFGVSSRIELVLKLGKLPGELENGALGQATVARRVKMAENRAKLNGLIHWIKSIFGKEIEMKRIRLSHLVGCVLATLLGGGLWVFGMSASGNLDREDFAGFLIQFLLLLVAAGSIVGWFGTLRGRPLIRVLLSALLGTGISPVFVLPLMRYVVVPIGQVFAGLGLLDPATMPAKLAFDLAIAVMLGLWCGLAIFLGILFQRISIDIQVNGCPSPTQREV